MAEPKPIRQLGRYALYAPIASGGMATVHLGRLVGPVGFSRTVAIKRLHPHLAEEEEFVSMFLDEARVAARIRHPNVVPTLDVIAQEGELFLVMEYVSGESLAKLLRAVSSQKTRIQPRIVSAIVCDALHGLHAAHETRDEAGKLLGIIHRDVSPQNIVVGTDGMSRVLDFGIAKAVHRLQSTREGQLKGKVAYMAPEQVTTGTADRTVDIYAASVVLWEALTGKRLFSAENDGDLITKITAGKVPRPSKYMFDSDEEQGGPLTRRVWDELDGVVLKGLARRPGERYATARDMATALEACLPPAARGVVGEWVEVTAKQVLDDRARHVAEIESDVSQNRVPAPAELIPILKSSPPSHPSSPGALGDRETTGLTPAGSGSGLNREGETRSVSLTRSERPDRVAALRSQRSTLVVAAAAFVLVGAAFAVGRSFFPAAPLPATASAPGAASSLGAASPGAGAAASSSAGIAITDAPHAASANLEAQTAYDSGLQALRDGSFDTAIASFEHATKLDAGFAAAFLRLAVSQASFEAGQAATRHALSRAAQGRSTLSEHDRALLDAFEPYLLRDPPDAAESERRLVKVTETYPRDAEAAFDLGLVRYDWGHMAEAREAYRRAAQLDSKFALASGYEGGASAYEGDFHAAHESLDRCLEVSPSGTDCLWFRAQIDEQEGDCVQQEVDAKKWIARDQEDFYGYDWLARALAGQNRQPDAVRAAFEQCWSRVAVADRTTHELSDKARLAIYSGDFAAAEGHLREAQRSGGANDPTGYAQSFATRLLVELFRETDRKEVAVKEAASYLSRGEAWVTPYVVDDGAISEDPIPWMLASLLHDGPPKEATAEAAFETKQAAWVKLWRAKTSGVYLRYLWVYGYAVPAETKDEAERALAAASEYAPLPAFLPQTGGLGIIGKVYLRAGRTEEALPFLRKAAAACTVLMEPFAHAQANLDLGQALEATGDRDGACAAYRTVATAWGKARPKSVSADRAKGRAAALGCK